VREGTIDCIITSPPYGDIKDYGAANQIGFGQGSLDRYLADIESVLSRLYRIAKKGAAFWLVLDSVRKKREMVPLTWEIVERARGSGWALQDCVVWDKGRSVPWSHHGRFRGVCEHVFLLAKDALINFDLEAVRDSEALSGYWVRYPERYHPDGKAPTDLWHFPIPVQGSWSNGDLRHFCPFPLGLVQRMVAISTKENDIVLDPFAGTGTVLAVSAFMKRFGLGIEVNGRFVRKFDKSGYDEMRVRAREEISPRRGTAHALRRTIIDLRILKYPRTLFGELSREDRLGDNAITSICAFVVRSVRRFARDNGKRIDSRRLAAVQVDVLAQKGADLQALRSEIGRRIALPPLSKFGLDVTLQVISYRKWRVPAFAETYANGSWYRYDGGRFHSHSSRGGKQRLQRDLAECQSRASRIPPVFAKLAMAVTKT
jgi:DNA modification methylase